MVSLYAYGARVAKSTLSQEAGPSKPDPPEEIDRFVDAHARFWVIPIYKFCEKLLLKVRFMVKVCQIRSVDPQF